MSTCFLENEKKFGFGFMRLPMKNDEVDEEECCRMVDAFLAGGFRYFDTAHGYLGGKSEAAIRTCLTSRYPRASFLLANKLSAPHFSRQEDIRPLFEEQCRACGVDYFDFYLMHAQNRDNYENHYKAHRAYETALALKREGRIRHLAISFHDTADVLAHILEEQPEIEAVQIQFNYLDADDPRVQSHLVWEVCRRFGKPVIVMEPVKGGSLVNLPPYARRILDACGGAGPASYALRYAAGFEGVAMVLSGMGSLDMVKENIACMKDPAPLNGQERAAIEEVRRALRTEDLIPCTTCRYCTEQCPQGIPIPALFGRLNDRRMGRREEKDPVPFARAADCIACGLCEAACPQHLAIRSLLRAAAKEKES